jgi:hypothetical protein
MGREGAKEEGGGRTAYADWLDSILEYGPTASPVSAPFLSSLQLTVIFIFNKNINDDNDEILLTCMFSYSFMLPQATDAHMESCTITRIELEYWIPAISHL